MKHFHLGVCMILILSSCSHLGQDELDKEGRNNVLSATVVDRTKTTLTDYTLSFSVGDALNIYAFTNEATPDYLNSFLLTNDFRDVNEFHGFIHARDSRKTDARYYAIYPSTSLLIEKTVTCELPTSQSAPFDPAATVMCARCDDYYNEESMPKLTFSFDQVLAPLRINISNTNPDYEDEEIKYVEVSSDDKICGRFRFDIENPGVLDFSDGENKLTSSFANGTLLGTSISTLVMIRPGQLRNLEVKLSTEKQNFVFSIGGTSVSMDKASVNVITIDPATVTPQKKKIVACWGDSFTNRTLRPPSQNDCNYTEHLQELLGEDWYVYNGGYNSNNAYSIIYHQREWEKENDADFSVFYIGRNGGQSNYVTLKGYYDTGISNLTNKDGYLLVGFHNRQYWSEAEKYPVVVSESEILDYRFDQAEPPHSYYETLIVPFMATGRYVDFYHTIISNWQKWLVRVGKYDRVEDIDIAVEYPGTGTGSDGAVMVDSNDDGIKDLALDWPQSFWYTNNAKERAYVHPSKWGAKAMAYMVYDMMYELHYVDSPALPAL